MKPENKDRREDGKEEYEEPVGEVDIYLARFYIDNWRERRREEIRQYEEERKLNKLEDKVERSE